MKKKSISLFVALFICVLFVNAQEKSDYKPKEEKLVRQTIEMYFEGWMTGDTTKLGKAMHTTCKLKNIIEDKVKVFERAKYLSFFKPRPRKKNATGKIIKIDITRDIASAKCEIETATRLYTDYFNLMKVKGEWYIVDKIATNTAKE